MRIRSQAAFVTAVLVLCAGCGDGGSVEFDAALAALRDGELRIAEAAAVRAAARAPDIAVRCEFLRGNIAFAQCELAEKQAATPAAEPFVFDIAIAYAEKARRFWQYAAMSRDDWPAARRNVERALLKIEELKRKKAQADEKRRRKSDPQRQPNPKPKPKPKPRPDEEDKKQGPEPEIKALSPEEVRALIERLTEKEQEKLALRRSDRKARMVEVERDW